MKHLVVLVLLLFTIPSFGQYSSANRPNMSHTKHELKTLRKFGSVNRRKKNVKFRDRTQMSHPAVTKDSRKILRAKRYER